MMPGIISKSDALVRWSSRIAPCSTSAARFASRMYAYRSRKATYRLELMMHACPHTPFC